MHVPCRGRLFAQPAKLVNSDAARSFGVRDLPIRPNSDRMRAGVDKSDFQKLDKLSTFWTSSAAGWEAGFPAGNAVRTSRRCEFNAAASEAAQAVVPGASKRLVAIRRV